MPDTREKWQQQTCKGTAEAKAKESVVSGPCLSKIYPSGIFLQLPPAAPLTWPPAHLHLLTHMHMHSASEVNL